jgi:Tol biopolymer transport system component/DNA-binding winged helix-turn-helix (wHTH) protein
MATSRSRPVSARFDQFEVDFTCNELRHEGVRVPVQEMPFHLLRLLLESEGRVVKREHLRDALWPADTFVDFEHGVNVAIRKLRRALGDSPDNPKFIETLPKLGYRFIVPVEWVPDTYGTDGLHIVVPIVRSESEPEETESEPTKAQWWKRKAVIALTACAVVVGMLYPRASSQVERLIRLYELQRLYAVPLTALAGNVWSPTFSPDGSQVAFFWDGGNDHKSRGLFVKVIGTEKLLRLTKGTAPAWSPDGRNIAFVRGGEEESGVFLISPLGGPERKIADRGGGINWYGQELSWSRDGKQLAYVYHPGNSASTNTQLLYLLSLESEQGTAVKTGCSLATSPAFSPRGDYLAWICIDGFGSASINLQRLGDGNVTQLLKWPGLVWSLAWSRDERRVVFCSDEGEIWDVALAIPGRPEKLPVGHDADSLAVSPTGNRLAFTQSQGNINIWRLDLSEGQPRVQKVISSSRIQAGPDFSPDGSKIAFESNRSGHYEVWVSDADGSNALQITSFGIRETGTPRWSPDGTQIVFDSRLGGESNLYIVNAHGGVPRKLSIDIHGNNVPRWSHDGSWIYFVNGEDARQPAVWKVSPNGGHAVRVSDEGERPIESPDGLWLYFVRQNHLWRIRPDGTDEQKVAGMPVLAEDKWIPVVSGVYFLSLERPEICFFDFLTAKTKSVYKMEKPAPGYAGGLSVSADGKWLLFPQVDEASSDIMMVENWQ